MLDRKASENATCFVCFSIKGMILEAMLAGTLPRKKGVGAIRSPGLNVRNVTVMKAMMDQWSAVDVSQSLGLCCIQYPLKRCLLPFLNFICANLKFTVGQWRSDCRDSRQHV